MPDPVLPPYVNPVVQDKTRIVERPWLEFFNNLVNRIATLFTWGLWQSWTPVMSNVSGGFVLGNGSLTGRYTVVNNTCYFTVIFVAGATTNFGVAGGQLRITLPFAIDVNVNIPTGSVYMLDSSLGIAYNGVVDSATTTEFVIRPNNAGSDSVRTTVPFAFAVSDRIRVGGRLEIP